MGVATNALTRPIDFWDQRGIYVLFQDFDPVYVGQTHGAALGARLRLHYISAQKADRWDRFSWYGIRKLKANHELAKQPTTQKLDVKQALNLIEGILISAVDPPLNRKSGNLRKQTTRYLQYPLRDESPSLDKLATELHERLDKITEFLERKDT